MSKSTVNYWSVEAVNGKRQDCASLLRNGRVKTSAATIEFLPHRAWNPETNEYVPIQSARIYAITSRGNEATGYIELSAEAMDVLAARWLEARLEQEPFDDAIAGRSARVIVAWNEATKDKDDETP